ncbi:MAG: AI-2E family transporter [Saprospiraceae bacterium]
MKKRLPHLFFLTLVLLVTAAFFGLIGEYLLAIFWAIVLAILFHNTYQWFFSKTKGKENLASVLTLLTILLLVVIPLLIVAASITNQGVEVYQKISSGEIDINQPLQNIQNRVPTIDSWLGRIGLSVEKIRLSIVESASTLAQLIGNRVLGFTQNTLGFLVQFSIMLYVLFFFMRDGTKILKAATRVMPLDDKDEWELMHRFASVARATAKGSLIVALSQGALGGILFWAVGIPGALLWAVLMTLLSLLPVGSGLIWGPAAIILFAQGEIVRAVVVVVVGVLLIGLIDNFLRPRLVGQDTKMPDYLILISTLGGLTWFGLSGFVLGPIIAALFVTCWQMLGKTYGGGKALEEKAEIRIEAENVIVETAENNSETPEGTGKNPLRRD